jgi:hypothetical protein
MESTENERTSPPDFLPDTINSTHIRLETNRTRTALVH